MAKMCVQLLKPNDYIYVSGHLESYSKVDRTGNPMSRYKIIANELHYIAQHNQRPDSQSPEEPESGTCQNQEESESEARQSPEESELEARQSLEESELEACQNPEESNLETCQKFKETEPDACQKYIEPHSGAETGMEKDKSDLCLWKVFFSSPDEWWDNRKNKKIPELPDFKHKTSGYALWLSPNDPPWIKRKLQFLDWKMGERCEEDRHKNRLYLWQVFFTSPHEWWDNRNNKKNPRSPDFKHKDTGEALWLSPNDPLWNLERGTGMGMEIYRRRAMCLHFLYLLCSGVYKVNTRL
ncbi:unnamed protein product [Dovyalis caffra]|uniref:Uncharacterized protein n=1 Tax=Dovyalis caffra TaxID=77055 RepID=A0AAV1SB43_9ROSI|nr:unnamed protein product [Dovyalis caffra]